MAHQAPREDWSRGEGPICPACKCQYTADESCYFDEDGMDIECECGIIFVSKPSLSCSWTTTEKIKLNK